MRTFLPLFLFLQAVLGWDPSLPLCPALPNIAMPMSLACDSNPILTPKAKFCSTAWPCLVLQGASLEGSYLLPLRMPGIIIRAAQELQYLPGETLVWARPGWHSWEHKMTSTPWAPAVAQQTTKQRGHLNVPGTKLGILECQRTAERLRETQDSAQDLEPNFREPREYRRTQGTPSFCFRLHTIQLAWLHWPTLLDCAISSGKQEIM